MAKTETLWGDFEEFEGVDPVEPNEDPVDPVEPIEEDSTKGKDPEPKEKTPEDKDPKVEEEPSIYDQIANSLEEDELLLLDDDKTYDESPDGFKEMIRDSVSKYRQKLEEEFKVKEEEIRNSYASANAPKIADLDPDDEAHATYMLEKYYLETGFTEDEAKEKIALLKDLDNVEKEAKIAKRFLAKQEDEKDKFLKQQQEQEEADRQKAVDAYITSIKTEINEMEEIAQFKLTPSVKKGFISYLFDVDKEGKTKAQKAAEDPNRRLRLAFLDYVDFNKKDFEIKAKTELANEYAKKASRFTSKESTSKGTTVKKQDPETQEFNSGFLDFWNSNK